MILTFPFLYGKVLLPQGNELVESLIIKSKFREYYKLDNNFYQAYYNRGSIYNRLGKNQLAKKDFNKAKKLAKKEIEKSKN